MPNPRNKGNNNESNSNGGGRAKRPIRGKVAKEGRPPPGPRKAQLVEIAATTLKAVELGSFELNGTVYGLKDNVDAMTSKTKYYPEKSNLSDWETMTSSGRVGDGEDGTMVTIKVSEYSTLVGVKKMTELLEGLDVENKMVGVLNFASAKNPGGGFIKGANAQEESIARSSTIYSSLMTDPAQTFYKTHRHDPKKGYYSHAMIYSPKVLFFRADNGDWQPPIAAEVVTSCAVNAGVVRRYMREVNSEDESEIDKAMYERMARVLFLFERHGVRNVVLGSFGTGVFKNRVGMVARAWKALLVGDKARFGRSFDRVDVAVIDHKTYDVCRKVFEGEDEVEESAVNPGDEESEEDIHEDNGNEDTKGEEDMSDSENQLSDSKL